MSDSPGLLARIGAALSGRGAYTGDSIANIEARMGQGVTGLNQSASSFYAPTLVSWNRQNLDYAYRGSFLVGIGVDARADDMTRASVEFRSDDLKPEDKEALESELQDLCVWDQLGDTIRWSRLYGGAIAVLLIDGQDVSTPLNVASVGKDQFKGLLVLDRWMVWPVLSEPIEEFGPDFGLPSGYVINVTNATGTPTASELALGKRIHYSRVLRFDGVPLPFYSRQQNNGWGQSVIERLYDRVVAFDSTTQGAAQLAYKAHLRVLRMKGLREVMALGGDAVRGLLASMEYLRRFQTNEGISLVDGEDEFTTFSYSFAGIPELLNQLGEQVAGALQTPLVRLFGQSPSGFSTGEFDLRNYEESVTTERKTHLRRPLRRISEVLCRSVLGRDLPEDARIHFLPLREMTAVEQADVATKTTSAVTSAFGADIITRKVALEELREAGETNGLFQNISDEDIDLAEDDPPPGALTVEVDPLNPTGDPNNANGPSPGPVKRPSPASGA